MNKTGKQAVKGMVPQPYIEAWRYFTGFYKGYHIRLAINATLSASQVILIIPALLLVKYAFDNVIPEKRIDILVLIGIIIILLRLINSALTIWLRSINIRIINNAIQRLRDDLVQRMYSFSRQFHTGADQNIIHARIVQDSERLVSLSTALISKLLPSVFISIALGIVLVFLNWKLFLLILAIIPLIVIANLYMRTRIRNRVYSFQRAFESFSKGIVFVLRYMDLTVIQSAQQQEAERQKQIVDTLREKTGAMAFVFAVNAQVQELLTGLTAIVVIIVGGASVATGAMTLGELISFYLASAYMSRYMSFVSSSFPDIVAGQESMITLGRLAEESRLQEYTGKMLPSFDGSWKLETVSFGYDEKLLIRELDLEIRPGKRVAIIGPNGSGKTTIANLILGLYAPRSGTLYASGMPYSEIDMVKMRRNLGVVPQHPLLFSGSILENITYGSDLKSMDEVVPFSRKAGAHDFIMKLPENYNTQIGDEGILLSGGECQRIAIARALAREPMLLILDEPTNHLDVQSVEEITGRLMSLESKPAILIISHDMSVVKNSDEIYRLEDGALQRLHNYDQPGLS